MIFKPVDVPGRWLGLAATAGLLLLDGITIWAMRQRPIDGLSFLLGLWLLTSLLLIAYIGNRTIGALTLQYWVDRDGVTLVWGATRQIVPMGEIQRIQRGAQADPADRPRPWHWPYPERRRRHCSGLGIVNSYATTPPAEQVILVTQDESYGLSPADAEGFVAALQARYALGPARRLRAELQRPPLWTWPLWRDRGALALIGAGLIGLLVMFGVLCFRYPVLSSDLPLHFDVNGIPDRIAPKSGLFALPIIGLLTWLVNLALGIWSYRRVQVGGAYLLWGGAVAIQGIAGLALFNLMRW